MKKLLILFLAAAAVFTLAACTAQNSSEQKSENHPAAESKASEQKSADRKASSKPLIIYFSWSGNTKAAAEEIAQLTGADSFEVRASADYPSDYNKCVEAAKQEKESGARPELAVKFDKNINDYDTIFIGYPCWWGTMPMPMFTLLESINTEGKTIVPFTTHEGSGFGSSLNDLEKLCPKAKLAQGIAIRGSKVKNSQKEIDEWIKGLSL